MVTWVNSAVAQARARNAALNNVVVSPVAPVTPVVPPTSYSSWANIVPWANNQYNAGDNQYAPWYALRNAPTVATPNSPVISKTYTNDLTYDPTNPEDYLMKLTARTNTSGKKPTEWEYYNGMLAQKALNSKQQADWTNPMQTQYDAQLKAYNDARVIENTNDTSALNTFKNAKTLEYQQKIAEAQAQWVKQKDAAQWVYSFSGFGRSTKAADTAVEIQKSTDNAINMLNAARDQEIAMEQARLAWANPESLASMQKSLEQSRQAVQQYQLDSIKKIADANAAWWASYMESLNNIMKTAWDSGLNVDKAGFEKAAQALWGMTEAQKATYLAQYTPEEQALLLGFAKSWAWTPALTKDFGTSKRPDWRQSFDNGKTWVTMSWFGGGAWWGWWWAAWWYKFSGAWPNWQLTTQQATERNDLLARVTRIADLTKDPLKRTAAMTSWFGSVMNDLKFIRSNLWFDKLVATKKAGATYGALSEWEWNRIDAAASSLPPPWSIRSTTIGRDAIIRDLNTVLEAAGYPQRVTAAWSSATPATTATPAVVYKQTATNAQWVKMWTKDWTNWEVIK